MTISLCCLTLKLCPVKDYRLRACQNTPNFERATTLNYPPKPLLVIANELIREGWELTRIEDLSEYSEIMTERVKLVFHRWVDYGG